MGSRASWGSVRKLPSGRYQARYPIEAKLVSAPTTFRTKRDAEAYPSTVRADMVRGMWVNPIAAQVTLRAHATTWLDQRPNLRPRTAKLYEGELRLHILPVLGDLELAKLTPAKVRSWHAVMLKAGQPGPSTVAKCLASRSTSRLRVVLGLLLTSRPTRSATSRSPVRRVRMSLSSTDRS